MKDVFISYSRKNADAACDVVKMLDEHGISTWMDYADITCGIEYAAGIIRGIRESKCFVVLLSSQAAQSRHVLSEINSAVNYKKRIFPIKIEEFEISDTLQYYLGCYQWFDGIHKNDVTVNKLINAIKQDLAEQPLTAPANGVDAPTIPDERENSHGLPAAGSYEQSASFARQQSFAQNNMRMVMFEEMLSLGYTAKLIATQLVENDYLNYEGISESNEGFADQWAPFIEGSSETFQYLLDAKNRIVGDWSIVAMDDEMLEAALNGRLLEKDIHFDNTASICLPGIYHGYILVMEILPNFRNQHNYRIMLDSFVAQLIRYADDGIFFKEFVINVFSASVERFIKGLGFTYKCDNVCFGKIYSLTMLSQDAAKLYRAYPELGVRYSHAED